MVKMKALGTFRSDGVGVAQAGEEFECDTEARANYLEAIGLAVKMQPAPKNKMAAAPRNKGKRNAN